MNPWDIVAWIGAASVSIVITALTVLFVTAVVRTVRNKNTSTRVL